MRVARAVGVRATVVTLWILAARYASRIEPGALQLLIIVTIFYFMLTNLGTRLAHQASAYSVFNRGERLPGQLLSEHFESEILHKTSSSSSSPPPSTPRTMYRNNNQDRHERLLEEMRADAIRARAKRRAQTR